MRRLSVSGAWTESLARLRSDGRLYAAVALAFFALPDLLNSLVGAHSALAAVRDPTSLLLLLVVLIFGMVGQLALARLAVIGQSSVGEALGHAIRRLPVLIAAGFIVALPLMIPLLPILAALQGVRPGSVPTGPQTLAAVGFLLWALLVVWIAARLILLSPVVALEPVGPVNAVRRCLALTRRQTFRLLGLIILFLIVAGVFSLAVTSAVGIVIVLALGRPESLSVAALLLGLVGALVQAAITTLFVVFVARLYASLSAPEAGVPSSGT